MKHPALPLATVLLLLCTTMGLAPATASADSITPESFSATIGLGATATVNKNVTITTVAGAAINYSIVSLDVVGLAPGLSVSFTPGSYTGAFDRSVDRVFGFNVGFTGDAPGAYNFEVVARVDGSIVARESDSIIVTNGEPVPEPASSLLLLGIGLAGLRMGRKRWP